MKKYLSNKLQEIEDKKKSLETNHLYYLSSEFKELRAKESILKEIIDEFDNHDAILDLNNFDNK